MKYKGLKIGNIETKIPLILGGMGIGVSGWNLASSITNNGGIGVLSGVNLGYREDDFYTNTFEANKRAIIKEIKKAKEESNMGVIGINFMVAMNRYKEYVKIAVEAGIDIIVSGAGLPLELPEATKDHDTKLIPIVSSAKAARIITKIWDKKYNKIPDAVVVEGSKAGGHLGFKKKDLIEDDFDFEEVLKDTKEVLKKYEDKYNKKIPMIAAGGIYSSQDVEKIMKIGYDGVQMATRFVTTEECDADFNFKNEYLKSENKDIDIIDSPVGLPGRAITNEFLNNVEEGIKPKIKKCVDCIKKCNYKDTKFCISQALINSVKGNIDEGLVFAGENAYKSKKIEKVADVVKELFY
jgi:NAD(P)H-dependent flavin oxidoreductase YrpB (nitropropane dioxygenase family)